MPPRVVVCHPFQRREALHLYRDVLRFCNKFTWPDPKGQPWGPTLARSARKEFDESRLCDEPETIARMMFTGREALEKAKEKFAEKELQNHRELMEKIERSRTDR